MRAIVFTLSPMFTVIFSFSRACASPQRLEFAGIVVGFIGTLLVASARGEVGRPVEWFWIGLVALVPVSLALGNVYRTIDLPRGAPSLVLAVGSNAVGRFAAAGTLRGTTASSAILPRLASVPGLVGLAGRGDRRHAGAVLPAPGGRWAGDLEPDRHGRGRRSASSPAPRDWASAIPAIVWIGIAIIAIGISLTVRARMRA